MYYKLQLIKYYYFAASLLKGNMFADSCSFQLLPLDISSEFYFTDNRQLPSSCQVHFSHSVYNISLPSFPCFLFFIWFYVLPVWTQLVLLLSQVSFIRILMLILWIISTLHLLMSYLHPCLLHTHIWSVFVLYLFVLLTPCIYIYILYLCFIVSSHLIKKCIKAVKIFSFLPLLLVLFGLMS